MEDTPAVERSSQLQYLPVLVGIFGSLVAGIQGLAVLGQVVALAWVRSLEDDPDVETARIARSGYLQVAGQVSVNVALAVVCIGAIGVTVRAARRGSPTAGWVCLGIVAVIALLTFTGRTWIGASV